MFSTQRGDGLLPSIKEVCLNYDTLIVTVPCRTYACMGIWVLGMGAWIYGCMGAWGYEYKDVH